MLCEVLRLVNSTISGENVVPPMLGKEHLDGERLVDARSFKRDVGERRIMGLVLMKAFKRGDDESRGLVLDGDRACELCPSRGELGEPCSTTGPRVELGERSRDTAVLVAGEAHDFCAEVRERVAVGLVVDEVQQDCAASSTRDGVDDVVGVDGVSVAVGCECASAYPR